MKPMKPKQTNCYLILAALILSVASGCGDPELHTISGKVTLGGEAHERLLVYFRPIEGEVNKFNLGVGETDAEGNLSMRSTAGDGLAEGVYRVCFSCLKMQSASGEAIGLTGDKHDDDQTMVAIELVPEVYADQVNCPVEFTIEAGQNVFEFDIPLQ